MARDLDVLLHGEVVGHLRQEDSGRLSFRYGGSWLEKSEAVALSLSLPLREGSYDDRAARPFFAGLLPDEGARERLARHLGLSRTNAFALLAEVGGECAGAVSLLEPGQVLPAAGDDAVHLDKATFADHLRALPRRPLLVGGELRLSLAGAQDKMALISRDGELFLPLGQAATTHIVKTGIDGFDDTVANEFFCLRLASRLGLDVPAVQVGEVDGMEYLLIERYDRRFARESDAIRRLHQEDFCQALGIPPEQKYQAEGGPSLARCFALLSECRRPAAARLALMRRVLFNFWIGNADAHGKNFALLYRRTRPDLAPLYDVLCTRAYTDHTDRMAMKIGGKRRFDEVLERHWRRLADETRFSWPGVRRIFREWTEVLPKHARELAAELGELGRRPVVARIIEGVEKTAAEIPT